MARPRKSEILYDTEDREYLNQLISESRDRTEAYAEIAPNWCSDTFWPQLVRDAGLIVKWDGVTAIVYYGAAIRTLEIEHKIASKRTQGSDIGQVVCRAYAKWKGLLR